MRGVLWDFGGVITASPFEAFNRFERAHGLPIDFIRTVNAANPDTNAWARFERNAISIEEFDAAFAEETAASGHRIPGRTMVSLLAGAVRPEMVKALEICRQKYLCVCLTNNFAVGDSAGMTFDAVRTREVEQAMALFHHIIESSKEGIRKPDPRIYRLVCERVGIAPADFVYLDDLGVNLKPARAMGMTTIKVTGATQALEELGRVLDLTLSQGGISRADVNGP